MIAAVGAGRIDGHITDTILTEFLHVRARRTSRTEAMEGARHLTSLVRSVLPVTDSARSAALSIFAASQRLGSNDALIAGVALDNQAQLASADQGFSDVPGLQLLIPGTTEFAALLSISR